MKPEIDIIAFDADDTLWVNEPFYQDAERKLEEVLRRYIDVEQITEDLYEVESKNLSLFGYGTKGFTISMIETAIELSVGKITAGEIQEIIEIGKRMMQNPIELLPGVRRALTELDQNVDLMLLTKGDLFDQESKIARSGLSHFFKYVEIVSEKDEPTYLGVFDKYHIKPARLLMVGNSLKSDILPIVGVGAHAVHIPCETTWVHEKMAEPLSRKQHFELGEIGELPRFVEETYQLERA